MRIAFKAPVVKRALAVLVGRAFTVILSNNHVIQDATSIKVMLSDKRTFTGKVVGADPQADVAVIRIDGKICPRPAWAIPPAYTWVTS